VISAWQEKLKKNFTSLEALASFLKLDEAKQEKLLKSPPFRLNVPLRLAEKMAKNSLEDPIFMQLVPLQEELKKDSGFALDPVGDQLVSITPKLLQKYEGRSLLLASSACALHCRFCFRQNFPYETAVKSFENELSELRANETIKEVILSGGDPLSMPDQKLDALLSALCEIEHLKRIRFHTRYPVAIAERIDDSFLKILAKCPKQIWFVVHINHPNELDEDLFERLKNVQKLGIPVLCQTVLLKGVNDSEKVLMTLFETLADNGIMAYYLHQLDKVQGAAHFEVEVEKGLHLIEGLRQKLSGYALPKYVAEISGRPSKTPLF